APRGRPAGARGTAARPAVPHSPAAGTRGAEGDRDAGPGHPAPGDHAGGGDDAGARTGRDDARSGSGRAGASAAASSSEDVRLVRIAELRLLGVTSRCGPDSTTP